MRIRVDQEFLRIETMAAIGVVRAVNAIAVKLPGSQAGHIGVPKLIGAAGQEDALDLAPARRIEEAKLHRACMRREERKIHPAPVPIRSQRQRRSLFDFSARGARGGRAPCMTAW